MEDIARIININVCWLLCNLYARLLQYLERPCNVDSMMTVVHLLIVTGVRSLFIIGVVSYTVSQETSEGVAVQWRIAEAFFKMCEKIILKVQDISSALQHNILTLLHNISIIQHIKYIDPST